VEVIDATTEMAATSSDPRAQTDGGARAFFEGYAADFDHIYDDTGKGPLARFVDTRLRKEMRIRFEKTFETLDPLPGRSLLDAGCGGGRYAIPAAKAGASRVLGLDFSEPMLSWGARRRLRKGSGPSASS
jgi:cyclopropane fatty-acyl-phospholipid synthase-like methyltransferase